MTLRYDTGVRKSWENALHEANLVTNLFIILHLCDVLCKTNSYSLKKKSSLYTLECRIMHFSHCGLWYFLNFKMILFLNCTNDKEIIYKYM